jgi:acyl-coenzyme A synthetase/AMP-(fatty) acid ligase
MSGYVGDEELTRSVLRDGTLYTSDGGEIDAGGNLHIFGRIDDVINVGGYKVSPSEVEDIALKLPEIKDCICIASTHPVLGPILKLLVVLDESTPLNKRHIAMHINKYLESYKIPTQYEAVESVKRTYNGKLDRKFYRK